MKKLFILAAGCMILFACSNEKKDETKTEGTTMSSGDKKPATELLDLSAADVIKKSFAAFGKGDVDAIVADCDDNVRYVWSAGDSAVGKQQVKDFYAARLKLIDSLSFSSEIVLPIQVNESQQPEAVQTGKWVLYWAMVNVKYKNAKKLTFWLHSVNHFNDANKVDFTGFYYDRQPIMEATKDMMK
jgi:hypothetical protein